MMIKCMLCACLLCIAAHTKLYAQPKNVPIQKETKKENREKLYQRIVNQSINQQLSQPLSDSTADGWQSAFYSISFVRYKNPWIENRVRTAFADIQKQSTAFQQSLLTMLYDMFPQAFEKEVSALMYLTSDPKTFALCSEYLLQVNRELYRKPVAQKTYLLLQQDTSHALLKRLFYRLDIFKENKTLPPLKELLQHRFFDNDVVVISFQRKNRNFPGMAVVRDSSGSYVKDSSGIYTCIPQLARSITNLPGYLSLGNTPQGIFRMLGTASSKNGFIGPTTNLQLTMPGEASIQHFANDSTIADTVWKPLHYQQLLPQSWKNYQPFFESYYAGLAGRTEIIAHGTTINPEWYSKMSCYPFTPSLGCLCTKEFWSPVDGSRTFSDQQLLADAVQKAGGANGYLLVIELDDKAQAVSNAEVQALLRGAL